MNILKEYQQFTTTTAEYDKNNELPYLISGLLAEVLEYNYFKELFESFLSARDYENSKRLSDLTKKEMGDMLWFCSQLCNYYNLSLSDIWEESTKTLFAERSLDISYLEELPKIFRGDEKYSDTESQKELIKNCVFSILNEMDDELLKQVILLNRDKLIDRQNRGLIKGTGNDR